MPAEDALPWKTQGRTRNSIGSVSHIVANTELNEPAWSRVVRTAFKSAEIFKRIGTDVNIVVFRRPQRRLAL
jgi:hypothetical protein